MIKRIDFLMPSYSLYDVLHHFTLKFSEAFSRAGYSCRINEGDDRILAPLENPPDLTICFNGAARDDQGVCMADLMRVPHISCLVDPPYRFFYLTRSNYIIITSDDHFGYEMLKAADVSTAFFMPHAAERELLDLPEIDRPYDVTMLGTFIDCEERRENWKTKFPDEICKAMDEAIEIVLSDDSTPFIWEVQQKVHPYLWNTRGAKSSSTFDGLTLNVIFEEVEIYLKGRDRIDLVNAIQDVPIHIFGSSVNTRGWQEYFHHKKNVIVHSEVPYKEALQILQQSKIVLNSGIKNKNGAHERVFSGMACGALVATNDNPYMRANFTDDKDLLLFQRSDFKNLDTRVKDYLSNESKRKAIAASGKEKIRMSHTWDHRVAELMLFATPIIEKMKSRGGLIL